MDHPLLGSLSELTDEEVSGKIAELNRKLGFALRAGNHYMCHQLRLAISSFMSEQERRLSKNNNTPYDEIIDIR